MKELLSGNHAIAEAVRLSKVQFIAAYPITPQTPIYERISQMVSDGTMDAHMMRAESEHSAMAACIAASMTGVRVFTATSSQGLALMHEMLHFASGNRVPIVMACVNRVVAAPWAFGSDQTDTLSQRDTGWMQLYCEDGQEALDTVIQAYWICEKVRIPAMVIIDGFYTSHFIEPVEVPTEDEVDRYLPLPSLPNRFQFSDPAFLTNVVDAYQYTEFKRRLFEDLRAAKEVVREADRRFEEIFERSYGMVEPFEMEGAECAIVTSGSITSCARIAVRRLREKGFGVGLLKVKLFRPFPWEELREHLKDIRRVVVIDRNLSAGKGGIFWDEIRSALYSMEARPLVFGYIGGLCGEDVPPEMIERCIIRCMERKKMEDLPEWMHGMST